MFFSSTEFAIGILSITSMAKKRIKKARKTILKEEQEEILRKKIFKAFRNDMRILWYRNLFKKESIKLLWASDNKSKDYLEIREVYGNWKEMQPRLKWKFSLIDENIYWNQIKKTGFESFLSNEETSWVTKKEEKA